MKSTYDYIREDCERGELLMQNIAQEIMEAHGYEGNLYRGVFSFCKIKAVLKSHGFVYIGSDAEREAHDFENKDTGLSIYIYPKTWYERQGDMRFQNIILN